MSLPTATRCVVAAAAGCALAAAFTTACSAAGGREAAGAPLTLRVMVKLAHGSEDALAIGAEATRVAGIPVSHAAAASTQWHALALHCASAAECDAALARLRAAADLYQAVEIEGRKTRSAS